MAATTRSIASMSLPVVVRAEERFVVVVPLVFAVSHLAATDVASGLDTICNQLNHLASRKRCKGAHWIGMTCASMNLPARLYGCSRQPKPLLAPYGGTLGDSCQPGSTSSVTHSDERTCACGVSVRCALDA